MSYDPVDNFEFDRSKLRADYNVKSNSYNRARDFLRRKMHKPTNPSASVDIFKVPESPLGMPCLRFSLLTFFCCWTAKQISRKQLQDFDLEAVLYAKYIFDSLDTDDSGSLDPQELIRGLQVSYLGLYRWC